MMAKIKTTQNNDNVDAFLAALPREETRQDCAALISIMSGITKCPPKMWGGAIIGFDIFHYRYANGKPGEICLVGFSPRKQNLVLYITGDHESHADLFAKLGQFKTGKACIYVNRLNDIKLPALKELIRRAVKARRQQSKEAMQPAR